MSKEQVQRMVDQITEELERIGRRGMIPKKHVQIKKVVL